MEMYVFLFSFFSSFWCLDLSMEMEGGKGWSWECYCSCLMALSQRLVVRYSWSIHVSCSIVECFEFRCSCSNPCSKWNLDRLPLFCVIILNFSRKVMTLEEQVRPTPCSAITFRSKSFSTCFDNQLLDARDFCEIGQRRPDSHFRAKWKESNCKVSYTACYISQNCCSSFIDLDIASDF